MEGRVNGGRERKGGKCGGIKERKKKEERGCCKGEMKKGRERALEAIGKGKGEKGCKRKRIKKGRKRERWKK